MRHILNSQWFPFLNKRHQRLVAISIELYEREYTLKSNFEDYSFIVFSMAKAYEGFLKRSFLDLKLIDNKTFEGKRFRIGKALNPDVNPRNRDKYWLYDDIEQLCGKAVAQELWETWLSCRNRVFHFFSNANNTITIETSGEYLLKISNSMKLLVECQKELGQYNAEIKVIENK